MHHSEVERNHNSAWLHRQVGSSDLFRDPRSRSSRSSSSNSMDHRTRWRSTSEAEGEDVPAMRIFQGDRGCRSLGGSRHWAEAVRKVASAPWLVPLAFTALTR